MALHNEPILVTGGSGYIASWVVKLLLAEGYHVRATVRNKNNPEKIAHLVKLAEEHTGVLDLVEADLLEQGSFEEGMQGCKWVIHTASPFITGRVKDAQRQLVDPALEGTRNVLESVNKTPSVERVVLTSSVAAVAGDHSELQQTPNGKFTEANWNQSSSLTHSPYSYSKAIAEREAWRIAEDQDRWKLVTLNPGFVMGPSLSTRKDAASIDFMLNLLGGQMKSGAPGMSFGIVDVRDVAKAHMLACEKESSSGRHLLVDQVLSILEMADIIRQKFPGEFSSLPKGKLPKFIFYILGPVLGFSWKFTRNNIDQPLAYDNSYASKDLGLEFTSVEDSIVDMVKYLQEKQMI